MTREVLSVKRVFKVCIAVLLLQAVVFGAVSPAFASDTATEGTAVSADDGIESGITDSSADSSSDDMPEYDMPTFLEIDTDNRYEGMSKAYRDGYVPRVQDGRVLIVLPLVPNGEINGDKITVSPDLGSLGADSPIVVSNYRKTVSLTEEKINGTENTRELFLVEFDLPLSSERYNGVYPVNLTVEGYTSAGMAISTIFTVYVTITDGKDPNAVDPIPEPETPTAEPVVFVSNSMMEPGAAEAGGEFTLTLTLKNSVTNKSVKNLLATVTTSSLDIELAEQTDTFQISGISAGGTASLELTFRSGRETPAGKYTVNLAFSYDSSETLGLTSSDSVIVEIKQPLSVEMVAPSIPENVLAGETVPVSVQVINMGREAVYNVRCEIEGPGLLPSNVGYVGTMEGGTQGMSDISLFIGAKTMSEGYEDTDERYGDTHGVITLTYEDADGEEYTSTIGFNTTIEPPVITSSSDQTQETPQNRGIAQWWISIVIVGVLIIGTCAFVFIRRRRMG